MAKYIYPAVFAEDGAFYTVRFPDLDSCYTQGDSLQDAYEMAEDVLALTLYNAEEEGTVIPAPSPVSSVKTSEGEFASLVACDTLEYRKMYDSRAIKKTLTIPSWLNSAALEQGINFSQVLQDALKAQLHLV